MDQTLICQHGQRQDYNQQQLIIHLTIQLSQLMGKHMRLYQTLLNLLKKLQNRVSGNGLLEQYGGVDNEKIVGYHVIDLWYFIMQFFKTCIFHRATLSPLLGSLSWIIQKQKKYYSKNMKIYRSHYCCCCYCYGQTENYFYWERNSLNCLFFLALCFISWFNFKTILTCDCKCRLHIVKAKKMG